VESDRMTSAARLAGIASCDPASTPASCNGDLLVSCENDGNVLVSHDCGLEERTCRTNSAGVFDCVGDTPCDLSTSQLRCDGAVQVACGGDTESRVDCSRFGMTCTLEVTSTGDQSSSSTACTPIDQKCMVGASESCQDGVISYCNLGLPCHVRLPFRRPVRLHDADDRHRHRRRLRTVDRALRPSSVAVSVIHWPRQGACV
jgi:hypothetical protein